MGRTTINVSDEVLKKILQIKEGRPQDQSRNETLAHIIYVYEEQKFRPEKGIIQRKPVAPIIDADKVRREFHQLNGGKCDL
jgi:hypothetical protein